ncbi:MAG: hypothetical protein LBH34_00280 [Prevotellaceae bacterium]|jgi:hypothetical protein|nr:hypothetical protein [Prevotellaceae bacterium]
MKIVNIILIFAFSLLSLTVKAAPKKSKAKFKAPAKEQLVRLLFEEQEASALEKTQTPQNTAAPTAPAAVNMFTLNAAKAAEAEKPVPSSRALTPSENRAYTLFRSGKFDDAAYYFSQAAKEKKFVMGSIETEDINKIIQQYVDAEMIKFFEKSEFEKTITYLDRVSEPRRSKKIQSLANKMLETLKRGKRNGLNIKDFELERYYADEEIFHLKSADGIYALNVDLASARTFKANFNALAFRNADYSVENNKLVLTKFTIYNPVNKKEYPFDEGLPTNYDISEIKEFYASQLGNTSSEIANSTPQLDRIRRSVSDHENVKAVENTLKLRVNAVRTTPNKIEAPASQGRSNTQISNVETLRTRQIVPPPVVGRTAPVAISNPKQQPIVIYDDDSGIPTSINTDAKVKKEENAVLLEN